MDIFLRTAEDRDRGARRTTRLLPALLLATASLAVPASSRAQLTLANAVQAARASSPALRAAAEAVAAGRARALQAGVFANPTFTYGREQTTRSGLTNAQNIAQLEQPIELGGQRAIRREAARARLAAAEARLDSVRAQLDLEVARALVTAVSAERRAQLATEASSTFAEAQRVSRERLAAGDISGYANRRLQLEAARYAAARAAMELERRTARQALAALMGRAADESDALELPAQLVTVEHELPAVPSDPEGAPRATTLDALVARAMGDRPDLRAVLSDADAAAADARLAARERIPVVTFSAGYKGERVADPTVGSLTGFHGVVAGVSLPLPLLDRRTGSIAAADADARRLQADANAVRRRVALEVANAMAALAAAESQRDALAPHLGNDTRAAVRAVQASYAEGDISLVEWLDAMRAYQDAEAAHVTLQGEVALRRATLAHAIGVSLLPSSPSSSSVR